MARPLRAVFMGTADFAVPSLRALHSLHEVVGVFCQPDRPKGRGNKLFACPVKEAAVELGLPVFQFERIRGREGRAALEALAPDVCVTAAFGQILSAKNLAVPRLGTINVHASLLPKYRGPAPIQWAVINGEAYTGITTMFTDVGVDTGDILMQKSVSIGDAETAGELFDRLALLGAETLIETLEALRAGVLTRTPQDDACATVFPMLTKEHGALDFNRPPADIINLMRGVDPWPGAFALTDEGETLKVWRAEPVEAADTHAPGCVLDMEGIVVAARGGAVRILELQGAGGRRMSAEDYLRGHKKPVWLSGRS